MPRDPLIHRPVVVLEIRRTFIDGGGETIQKLFLQEVDRRSDRPGRRIGEGDLSIAINADDRVRGRLQYLFQLFRNCIAFAFCHTTLINIAEDQDDAGQLAFIVADRAPLSSICISLPSFAFSIV